MPEKRRKSGGKKKEMEAYLGTKGGNGGDNKLWQLDLSIRFSGVYSGSPSQLQS